VHAWKPEPDSSVREYVCRRRGAPVLFLVCSCFIPSTLLVTPGHSWVAMRVAIAIAAGNATRMQVSRAPQTDARGDACRYHSPGTVRCRSS